MMKTNHGHITCATQISERVCRATVAIVFTAALSSNVFSQGIAIDYVVPRFLETVEGNVRNLGGDPYPNGWRLQFIYAGSEFEDLPDSYRLITEMRWRPDASVASPLTSTDPWEIRLSTTQKTPSTISSTYEENIDSPQTLVLEREITRSTANSGPAEGPRNFDISFPFDTPFHYDPAAGNLLVDVINLGPTADTDYYLSPDLHLGTNGLGGFVGDPDGFTNPVAPNIFPNQIVPAMFVFVPEPSGIMLLAMGFTTVASCRKKLRRV